MTKYLTLKTQMYPIKIHIIVGVKNTEELMTTLKFRKKNTMKEFKKEKYDEIDKAMKDETWDGFTLEHQGHIIVVVKKWDAKSLDSIDSLFHEIGHSIFKAAEFCGFKHSDDSEEFYTYLLGFIARNVFKALF